MSGKAFGKNIFVDTVLSFMNESEMLMNFRVIIERDIFYGFDESFLSSFVKKFFGGRNLFFIF
jgi:hypothetical protein